MSDPFEQHRFTGRVLLGLDPLQTVRIFAGSGGASGVVEPLPFDAAAFTGQTLYVDGGFTAGWAWPIPE